MSEEPPTSPRRARSRTADENPIGVVAILGSTFDGSYEPDADIRAALDELEARTGLDVPVHVDGASGGFIAPFLDPELVWDFRQPRVQSINASGHKFGLVSPGVGWALWRDAAALPEELVFHVDYLGGDMPTFALNFSRPGGQVVVQYHQFLRLGREGYREVQQACRDTASCSQTGSGSSTRSNCSLSGASCPCSPSAPPTRLRSPSSRSSEAPRAYGWIVPAYHMPEGLSDTAVLRIVVRNGFSRDMAAALVEHLARVARAGAAPGRRPERRRPHGLPPPMAAYARS